MPPLKFSILHRDQRSNARLCRVETPHGGFDTPAFMPVGTQATIKGLLPGQVAATGAQIILANTYHLLLRPGPELVAKMGGLQRWMGWPGPILTDSGGFQVFSLADIRKIGEDGVTFRSHLDGNMVELTPERSIAAQNALGADIIMAFDDCPAASDDNQSRDSDDDEHVSATPSEKTGPLSPATEKTSPSRNIEAAQRTARWLQRSIAAHERKNDQALFGIVQGGTDLALRTWCANAVTAFDLPGYAIGGVAVGEGFEWMKTVVEHSAPLLPAEKPRYLMGVGYERDILMAVRAGVDMFDCVLPTRNGRNAYAFTSTGALRLRNAKYADDPRVIEEGCDCPACSGLGEMGLRTLSGPYSMGRETSVGFSRSYLRHLFQTGEMLGPILLSAHNLRHFQRFVLDIRRAIVDNDWSLVHRRWPVVGNG